LKWRGAPQVAYQGRQHLLCESPLKKHTEVKITHTHSLRGSTHSIGNTWEGELCGEKACGGEREICTGSEKDFSEST